MMIRSVKEGSVYETVHCGGVLGPLEEEDEEVHELPPG